MRSTRGLVLWLLVIPALGLLLVGCKQEASTATAPDENELLEEIIPDSDIERMEFEVLVAARQNATRTCPRPVLRGKALPGTADELLDALVRQEALPRKCAALLADEERFGFDLHPYSDVIMGTLFAIPESFDSDKAHFRVTFPPRPLFEVAETKKTERLRKACQPAWKKLQQAVRHQEACSPYRVGLRNQLPPMIGTIRLGKLALLEASVRAKAGNYRSAFWLLVDLIRFGQDLSRGRTNLIVPMIGLHALGIPALMILQNLLNTPARIAPATLEQLQRQLTLLQEHMPHGISLVQGDHLSIMLMDLMPMAKPEGWTPMGGGYADSAGVVISPEERHLARLAVLFGYHRFKKLQTLCRDSRWPADCTRELRTYEKRVRAGSISGEGAPKSFTDQKLGSKIASILIDYGKDGDKEMTRDRLSRFMESELTPVNSQDLRVAGRVLFALAVLRLHVEFRLVFSRTGGCPSLKDFERPPLSRLRLDPYAGKPMKIESVGKNRFEIKPALPLWRPVSDESWPTRPRWILQCPTN